MLKLVSNLTFQFGGLSQELLAHPSESHHLLSVIFVVVKTFANVKAF